MAGLLRSRQQPGNEQNSEAQMSPVRVNIAAAEDHSHIDEQLSSEGTKKVVDSLSYLGEEVGVSLLPSLETQFPGLEASREHSSHDERSGRKPSTAQW